MTPRKHITGPPCGTCGADKFYAATKKCVRCRYRRVGEKNAEAARIRNAARLANNLPLTTPEPIRNAPPEREARVMQNVRYEDS